MFISIAFHLNSGMARPAAQSSQLPPAAEKLPHITGTSRGEVAMHVGQCDFTGETDQAGALPHYVVFSSLSMTSGHSRWTHPSSCAHYSKASSRFMLVVTPGQPDLGSSSSPAPARYIRLFTNASNEGWSAHLPSDKRPLECGQETPTLHS